MRTRVSGNRRGERGQTILLVAVSIVSLLAMAALAIDVVSLYVARNEVQRAADAAALAGAKAIADSGVTSVEPGDANLTTAEGMATSMATAAINSILSSNFVAGGAPTLATGSPVISFTPHNYNPTVTVTLQQSNLPSFFSRIWGSKATSTSATAVAEAYNSSNQQNYTQIQTTCMKPLLVGNTDPGNSGNPFITTTDGTVNGSAIIGEQFALRSACPGGTVCSPVTPPLRAVPGSPGYVQYVPATVNANPGDVYPTVTAEPCNTWPDQDMGRAIAGCNITNYSCGTNNVFWNSSVNPANGGASSDAATATECLIHASGTGLAQGQDSLNPYFPYPSQGAPQIVAGGGPMSTKNVTTSSSIATFPVINTDVPPAPGLVSVLGFLQVFITDVSAANTPDLDVTVLNVIGCSNSPNANPPVIGGNGTSPIPVRLISTGQ